MHHHKMPASGQVPMGTRQEMELHLWVSDQQVVTDDLHLVAHQLVNLAVMSPVILVKGVLNRENRVLLHKRLVQLNEFVSIQL